MMENINFIVITGPTAVGKSSLALELAHEYELPIISADSRQIFKEMNIGTAKPSEQERHGVPHIWLDEKTIHEKISAGIFVEEVMESLRRDKISTAIVCGGTQFYIESLLYGLDQMPSISEDIKDTVQEIYEKKGLSYLKSEIASKDPLYYQTADLENPRRLQRALEIILASGKTYTSFLKSQSNTRALHPKISFFLTREREELYHRINTRVDMMLEQGLEEEALALHAYKTNTNLQTVGYQEFFDYFDGKVSREEAIRLIKRNTRRYAKRQVTWYRSARFRYFQRSVTKLDLLKKEVQLFLLKQSIQ